MAKATFLTVSLCSAALMLSPAQAQESYAIVDYSDLNLNQESGIERLDERIRTAVRKVCRPDLSDYDRLKAMATKQCRRETLDAAMAMRDNILSNKASAKVERFASFVIKAGSRR